MYVFKKKTETHLSVSKTFHYIYKETGKHIKIKVSMPVAYVTLDLYNMDFEAARPISTGNGLHNI